MIETKSCYEAIGNICHREDDGGAVFKRSQVSAPWTAIAVSSGEGLLKITVTTFNMYYSNPSCCHSLPYETYKEVHLELFFF